MGIDLLLEASHDSKALLLLVSVAADEHVEEAPSSIQGESDQRTNSILQLFVHDFQCLDEIPIRLGFRVPSGVGAAEHFQELLELDFSRPIEVNGTDYFRHLLKTLTESKQHQGVLKLLLIYGLVSILIQAGEVVPELHESGVGNGQFFPMFLDPSSFFILDSQERKAQLVGHDYSWELELVFVCRACRLAWIMQFEKAPYYFFLIVRPDGNAAYRKMHEAYPLDLQTNQILQLASTLFNMNTLQAQLVHPAITKNRKDEVNLPGKTSFTSINTTTYQIRFLDTVSEYLFILAAANSIDSRKIDGKLDELYRTYVDYVFKAPFFNNTEAIEKEYPAFVKKSNEILYS